MSILHKYTLPGSNIVHTIVIPHIVRINYDDDTNQVNIELTSGSIITLTTTTETLYESLLKKIELYHSIKG